MGLARCRAPRTLHARRGARRGARRRVRRPGQGEGRPDHRHVRRHASFVEKDVENRKLVIKANGKEAKGAGTAAATITAVLKGSGEDPQVVVSTDLAITGRPAQFGRGVMVDVSNKLLGKFTDCLSEQISGAGAEAAPANTSPLRARPPAATAHPRPRASR